MWDNNPDWYQHKAPKYEPKWEKQVDYNPDHHPSFSRVITGIAGNRIIRLYHVRGYGVLVFETYTEAHDDKVLNRDGCAIFTNEEIGYAPHL